MTKPDPELLPDRPRCLRCYRRMRTMEVTAGPEGFERRTFECSHCGFTDSDVFACDPMNSDAVGWISGELGRASDEENPPASKQS